MNEDTPPISEADAIAQLEQLVERNRVDSARSILAEALPLYPDSSSILVLAAWVEYLDDDDDEAKELIARVLEMEPKHYGARYLLALIHQHLDEHIAAEEVLTGLLKEYPEEVDLYALYARTMLATSEFERAQRLADEALRRDPENLSALISSVLAAYVNSPGAETREQLAKLMREYPDQIQTTLRVIQILIDEGKHAEAYDLARELVSVDPGNQHLVDLAMELKVSSHWSMKPLWPMRKWGWGGSIAIWLIIVAILRTPFLETLGLESYSGLIASAFLIYVVYSWVWPWLFKKIVTR